MNGTGKISLFLYMVFLFCFSVFSVGQQSYLMNQKVFNRDEINYGKGVAVVQNRFFVVGDNLVSDTCSNFYFAKIDDDTSITNLRFYGGSSTETVNAVLPLGDTGFLLAGSAASNNGDLSSNFGLGDCWLVRTDTAGNILWQQNYGGSAYDRADAVAKLPEGGFVVTGSTRSADHQVGFNHGESDLWLFKIDDQGNLLWEKTLGGSDVDNGKALIVLDDTLLMIFGNTKSDDGDVAVNHGKSDYWLIRFNMKGDTIVWEKTYGDEESDAGSDMIEAHDGGYILAGSSRTGEKGIENNGKNDYRVLKVDKNGQIIWDHSFGGSMDEIANDVLTADGEGYLVSGYTYSQDGDVEGNHGGRDMWIVKLNNDGKMEWQRPLGGMYHEVAYGADVCNDGGYRITGYAISKSGDVLGHDKRKMDTWTVKLCEENVVKDFVNICDGQSYEWEGDVYDEEGTYEKYYVNRCGFDSIRQLKLRINDYPESFEIEGEEQPYFGKPFTYSAPLIYQNIYHWFPVNGVVVDTPAFNRIAIAWGGGGTGVLKAVAERPGGCLSDTAFFEVTIVGEAVNDVSKEVVSAGPVPVSDVLTVKGKHIIKAELYGLSGNRMLSADNHNEASGLKLEVSALPAGVYYLKIKLKHKVVIKKIVKI